MQSSCLSQASFIGTERYGPTLPFPQPHISESDQTDLKAGHGNTAQNLRNMEARGEGLQVQGYPGLGYLHNQQNLPPCYLIPPVPT